MSYDISLEILTGKDATIDIETWNPTYNVGPMFRKSLWGEGVYDLNGVSATDAVPILEKAIKEIEDNFSEYEKLNPSNWWWSVDTAIETLKSMLEAAKKHDLAQFKV